MESSYLRVTSILFMAGATVLLVAQLLWTRTTRRGHPLHAWGAAWGVLTLVFLTGRYVQLVAGTPELADVGTRLQFLAAIPIGVVAMGILQTSSKRPGRRRDLWLIGVASGVLTLIVVATDGIVAGELTSTVDGLGFSYLVMKPGPLLPVLGLYAAAIVVHGVRLALRSRLRRRKDRLLLVAAAAVFATTAANDSVALLGVPVVQCLDVGLFADAMLIGYVVSREAHLHYQSMRATVSTQSQQIRAQAASLARSGAELAASEARFRLLSEATSEGIVIHEGGLVIDCNPQARDLLRDEGCDLPGSELDGLFAPESAETAAAAVNGQTREPVRATIRRHDGTTFPAVLLGRRAELEGRAVGILAFRDQTTQRALEARLVSADRVASLGTLAASVAHEINNPLAWIVTNLELLSDDVAPQRTPSLSQPERREMLLDALQGCERVRRIVQDLKALSRGSESDESVADVERVVQTSLSIAGHELRHRARVKVDHASALPAVAIAPSKLGQVLLNGLVNAAHSLPIGRAHENRVTLRTRFIQGRVNIEIIDTGQGIDADGLTRVFEPYYTTRSAGHGAGLGLWISQVIIADAGGDIAVFSQVGGGTTVRIRLPPAPGVVHPQPPPTPALLEASLDEETRIVILDDEPMAARAMARMLRGHCVLVTDNGQHGVELCCREQPDVILCDIMMPDISGPELYDQVVAREPELAPRFVFVTGGAFSEDTEQFLATTTRPILWKPITRNKLLEAVHDVRRRRSA